MERSIRIEPRNIKRIDTRLSGAQLEMYGDDIDDIQIMIAGDEASIKDLKIDNADGKLNIVQPQYARALNIAERCWLQICIRIPKSLTFDISMNTVSGLINARKINGNNLTLDTISGDIRIHDLTSDAIVCKSVSGNISGESVKANKLTVRSVSGDVSFNAVEADTIKGNSVNGKMQFYGKKAWMTMEITTVTGNLNITAPMKQVKVSLRTLSGHIRTEGVDLVEEGIDIPQIHINTVSADVYLLGIQA